MQGVTVQQWHKGLAEGSKAALAMGSGLNQPD